MGILYAAEDLGPRVNLFKIDRIDLKGLKKVEKEAVLEKIGSRVDMVLDNYLLKKDLEKIYSMKYFVLAAIIYSAITFSAKLYLIKSSPNFCLSFESIFLLILFLKK